VGGPNFSLSLSEMLRNMRCKFLCLPNEFTTVIRKEINPWSIKEKKKPSAHSHEW